MSSLPTLTTKAWSGHGGLAAARTDWEKVMAECDADPLFNGPSWAQDYAAAFVADGAVFGWTIRDQDAAPVAVLAFRREPSRGAFALPRATLLADGTFDSDYLDLVHRRGRTEEVLSLVLDRLAARRDLQSVVLSGVPGDSPTLPALRDALRRRRLPFRERPVPGCAAPLASSFDDYLATLKPRMRGKARSALRRGEEAGATYHWCDEPTHLDRHLATLFELHRRRWNAVGQAGSFTDERRRRFYGTAMPRFLRERRLRLSRLHLDGEDVAYQLGVVMGGRYYQLQEGYDPAERGFRLGIALRGWSIARLIEEGVRTYDFLAGISRPKTDWGAVARPATTIAFALPRRRARLAYGLRAALDRRRRPGAAP